MRLEYLTEEHIAHVFELYKIHAETPNLDFFYKGVDPARVLRDLHDPKKCRYPDGYRVGSAWSPQSKLWIILKHGNIDCCFDPNNGWERLKIASPERKEIQAAVDGFARAVREYFASQQKH